MNLKPMQTKRVLLSETPWHEVTMGMLGLQFPDKEIEVDGDRQVVRLWQIIEVW